MTLDVTCQSCDASFAVDLSDLLEEAALECPSCEAKAPRGAVEGVTGALDELFVRLATLNRKFGVVMEVDSDDLPVGYEPETRREAGADEDEEDDADEDGWDEEPGEEADEEEER